MIDWEKFKNPDTLSEALVEAKDYVSSLEKAKSELEQSVTTLRDTNQRLYLKVSTPINEDKPETPSTTEDINDEISQLLFGKKE